MNPQSVTLAKRFLLMLVLCLVSMFLLKDIVVPGFAQKPERELEDKVPKHVPIKVKVNREKEKAFKDLKNEDWLRNFELEVTNTSDKPIYFLELWLMLPETKTENNRPLAFTLRYGRADFINSDTLPVADDVPIQPRETYTFVLPEAQQQAWQKFKLRRKEADPKKVRLKFIQLNFGDGTGFSMTDAMPYPYKKKQASNVPFRQGPKLRGANQMSSPDFLYRANREVSYRVLDLAGRQVYIGFVVAPPPTSSDAATISLVIH